MGNLIQHFFMPFKTFFKLFVFEGDSEIFSYKLAALWPAFLALRAIFLKALLKVLLSLLFCLTRLPSLPTKFFISLAWIPTLYILPNALSVAVLFINLLLWWSNNLLKGFFDGEFFFLYFDSKFSSMVSEALYFLN